MLLLETARHLFVFINDNALRMLYHISEEYKSLLLYFVVLYINDQRYSLTFVRNHLRNLKMRQSTIFFSIVRYKCTHKCIYCKYSSLYSCRIRSPLKYAYIVRKKCDSSKLPRIRGNEIVGGYHNRMYRSIIPPGLTHNYVC